MLPRNLSDDIVQHIQSFMNFRNASQSATLSKRLYDSWYVRTSLDLDDREFHNEHAFWYGAKKTIRRYTIKGLKLESLTINISSGYERSYECKKLVEEAAPLGVREISLIFRNDNFNFIIPFSVLTSPHLLKFSLTSGALHIGHEHPLPSTTLHTLNLMPTRSIGYIGDFIYNIVCHCEALLNLTCPGFLLSVNLGRLGLHPHKLQSLTVHNLNYNDNLYFNELIRFFTSLRKVTLKQVLNSERLHICSQSLEEIVIHDLHRAVTVVLRVPTLKVFTYVGVNSSTFTFESPDFGWTSVLDIVCYRYNDNWFHMLRKFIQRIASSKIKLCVRVMYDTGNTVGGYRGDGDPIAIESLDVVIVSPNPHLVDGLFSVCIPNYFQYYPDFDSDME